MEKFCMKEDKEILWKHDSRMLKIKLIKETTQKTKVSLALILISFWMREKKSLKISAILIGL